VEERNKHINKLQLEYSTVQFNLNNPTTDAIEVELDTNVLTQIPQENTVGALPNQYSRQICGGRFQGGLYYNPNTKKLISGGTDAVGVNNITQVIDVVSGVVESTQSNSISSLRMKYVPSVNRIYSIQTNSGIISVIDADTGVEISTIPSPAFGTKYTDLDFSVVSNKLYLMDVNGASRVNVLDVITNTYIASIPMGNFSTNLAYSPTNNRVYVSNSAGGDRFRIIDCVTDTIVGNVPPFVTSASEMIYNSVDNVFYFVDSIGGNVRVLDISTDLISLTIIIPIGVASKFSDMTYSGETNTIWGVNDVLNNIDIIDCNLNVVTSTLPLPSDWNGQVEYAEGINTTYTSPNAFNPCIREISSSISVFNVSGSTDINLWIRDTLINPKQIDRIKIYAEKNSDLLNPLTVGKEDANGIGCSFVELPNTSAGVSQIQSQIGQIDFDNYIFDVTSTFKYTIPPLTTIKWVVYYKEYDRSDLLAGTVMIEEFDAYKPSDPDTYDEKFLIDTKLRPTVEINKVLNVKS
jgi:hypothetical protein